MPFYQVSAQGHLEQVFSKTVHGKPSAQMEEPHLLALDPNGTC